MAHEQMRTQVAASLGRFSFCRIETVTLVPTRASLLEVRSPVSFMLLVCSRYLALVFAIGLGIGEAVINWGHWQYAPLWIVDYVIVGWLLWAFFKTRSGGHVHSLLSGWAFTAGIFYMALFVSLDPAIPAHMRAGAVLLILMGSMLGVSILGLLCASLTIHTQHRAGVDAASGPGSSS